MPNTELEDLIEFDCYKNEVRSEFGVLLEIPLFRGNDKWSNRVKKVFEKQGKMWNDSIEMRVKALVCSKAAEKGYESLNPNKSDSISHLIDNLKSILNQGN